MLLQVAAAEGAGQGAPALQAATEAEDAAGVRHAAQTTGSAEGKPTAHDEGDGTAATGAEEAGSSDSAGDRGRHAAADATTDAADG